MFWISILGFRYSLAQFKSLEQFQYRAQSVMPHGSDGHKHHNISRPGRDADLPGGYFINSHCYQQRHQKWIGHHREKEYSNRPPAVHYFHKTRQFYPAQKSSDGAGVDFIRRVGEIDIRHEMLACPRREIHQHRADGGAGGRDESDKERIESAAEGEGQRKQGVGIGIGEPARIAVKNSPK